METTELTILEDNKLIAEFMGYKLAGCNNGLAWESPFPHKSKDDVFKIHGRLFYPEKHQYYISGNSYLKFNSDWNWLMPVIEKIENLHGASIIIGRMFCEINYEDHLDTNKHFSVRMASGIKLNAAHAAVVEFIKWVNEHDS